MEIRDNKLLCNKPVDATLSSGAGQFRAYQASNKPSFLIRNDGNDTYFMLTNASDPWGNFNSLRPFRISNTTGWCWFGHRAKFSAAASDANFPQIVGNGTHLSLGPWDSNVYDIIIGNSGLDGNDSYALRPSVRSGAAGHLHLGSPTYRWRNIYSATSVNVSSDRRMKKDIEYIPYENSVAFVKNLKPAQYRYIDGDSGRIHRGLIAQDVEDSFNSLNISSMDFAGFIKSPIYETTMDENGNEVATDNIKDYVYSLRYDEFESDMINVLKYLLEENESIKQQLKELKGGNANG